MDWPRLEELSEGQDRGWETTVLDTLFENESIWPESLLHGGRRLQALNKQQEQQPERPCGEKWLVQHRHFPNVSTMYLAGNASKQGAASYTPMKAPPVLLQHYTSSSSSRRRTLSDWCWAFEYIWSLRRMIILPSRACYGHKTEILILMNGQSCCLIVGINSIWYITWLLHKFMYTYTNTRPYPAIGCGR